MPSLAGRKRECEAIVELLESARAGVSAVLVVRGEPGIGKTALLDYAVESAAGFDVARIAGIESEMELGFAGLHQLLLPFLDPSRCCPCRNGRPSTPRSGSPLDRPRAGLSSRWPC